jgi:nucleoside-diphosphate-sugar epimerase
MPGKALITGVAGFIGSHLATRLVADGYDVVGIDCFTDYYDVRIKRLNLEPLLGGERFRLVEESLLDTNLEALLDGVEVVYHEAAQAGVRASWGEQFETYVDANIRATQRVCEALKSRSSVKLVYASSSSVYGDTTELPMRETHPTRPVSPYGVTKLDGENLCLLYNRNYGLPVVCLRYFTVYGPRQRPDMAFHRFLRAAIEGAPLHVFGSGEQTRDFTFVDDIVEANVAALSYTGDERVFNIGGGSRVTLNRTLDLIAGHAAGELDIRYSATERGDVMHTYADTSLAQRELGYAPRVSVEEGIGREAEWVRDLYRRLSEREDTE